MNNFKNTLSKTLLLYPVVLILTYAAIAFILWNFAWPIDIPNWYSLGRLLFLAIVVGLFFLTIILVAIFQLLSQRKAQKNKQN